MERKGLDISSYQKGINFDEIKSKVDFIYPIFDEKTKTVDVRFVLENEDLKFTFGTSGVKTDSYPKNLHRIAMENGSSAESELGFESNYYRVKNIFNINQIKRL